MKASITAGMFGFAAMVGLVHLLDLSGIEPK